MKKGLRSRVASLLGILRSHEQYPYLASQPLPRWCWPLGLAALGTGFLALMLIPLMETPWVGWNPAKHAMQQQQKMSTGSRHSREKRLRRYLPRDVWRYSIVSLPQSGTPRSPRSQAVGTKMIVLQSSNDDSELDSIN